MKTEIYAGSDDRCYGYTSKFTLCKAFANAILYERGEHETLQYEDGEWNVMTHALQFALEDIKFCPYCGIRMPTENSALNN